jgi:hypothetical protein
MFCGNPPQYYGRICPQRDFGGNKSLINEVLSALTTLKEVNKLPAMQDILVTVVMSGHGYVIEPHNF